MHNTDVKKQQWSVEESNCPLALLSLVEMQMYYIHLRKKKKNKSTLSFAH